MRGRGYNGMDTVPYPTTNRGNPPRLVVLNGTASAFIIATLYLFTTACGGGPDEAGQATDSVRGMVTDVKSSSLVNLDSLVVEDQDGRSWEFTAGSYSGFTPSHLREHMVLAEPVTVKFRVEGDLMIIEEVTD